MWPDVPRSPEEIERLRDIVYANPTIVGRLVSEDGKAALITAAFHEERLDYKGLFQRIQQAIKEAEDRQDPYFCRRRAHSLWLDLPLSAPNRLDHRAYLLQHSCAARSLLP